ncbi:hypothetical protein HQ571_03450 [Candidatus Kuenenbacteria bacterium]|nr:hypothetical protein [Candidatus Kuenenbacteria bacterium]
MDFPQKQTSPGTVAPKPAPVKPVSQPSAPSTKKGMSGTIVAILFVVALLIGLVVAGGGVYFWLSGSASADIVSYEQTISDKDFEISTLTSDMAGVAVELENAQMVPVLADIKIEHDDTLKTATVYDGDTLIKEFEFETLKTVNIFKQTSDAVYLAVNDSEMGGGALYAVNPREMYKYDLRTGEVTNFVEGIDDVLVVYDISSDGRLLVYRPVPVDGVSEYSLKVHNFETGTAEEFLVSDDFLQYGSVKLSPNAKMIAYAAADLGGAASGVMILDLESKENVVITFGENKTYHIRGWDGNKISDLQYYFFH